MTFKGGLSVLAVIIGASFSVGAQSTAAATQKTIAISGTICDPNGAVVPAASVIAISKSAGVFRTRTDDEGKFRLDLMPDDYEISIAARGFKKLVYSDLRINPLISGKMNFNLVIEGSTDHEPCGYGGHQCCHDEIPKDLTTLPPLIETKIQTRPLPKKPAKKMQALFLLKT